MKKHILHTCWNWRGVMQILRTCSNCGSDPSEFVFLPNSQITFSDGGLICWLTFSLGTVRNSCVSLFFWFKLSFKLLEQFNMKRPAIWQPKSFKFLFFPHSKWICRTCLPPNWLFILQHMHMTCHAFVKLVPEAPHANRLFGACYAHADLKHQLNLIRSQLQ